jgi:branched-chain amino acid transport system permease protein
MRMASGTRRGLIWGSFALLLAAAPLLFRSAASLSLLSQIGTMMIFGLSYNMLLGQGGMLSFGHAVYFGLGAFFAAHAMNLVAVGVCWLPVTLIPLVGGLAGLGFGIVSGYFATRRAGTVFSMITLGLGELVYACAQMFPGFFGGEGGIATNRVIGAPVFGISYGPQIEVYYLIAFWLLISTLGMFAFTRTPLGQMLNAVRDNPERAAFLGYDDRRVRYLALIGSAFFAGIAGALSAINFEIAGAENLGAARSGAVLLFTVIGGSAYFFGPMLGAIVGVFFSMLLPGISKAWQLYLGLFFIAVVMVAPGGIAGILVSYWRAIEERRWRTLWRLWLAQAAAMLVLLTGVVLLVEMLYRLALDAADGVPIQLAGFGFSPAQAGSWLLAGVLLAAGLVGWRRAGRSLAEADSGPEPEVRQ